MKPIKSCSHIKGTRNNYSTLFFAMDDKASCMILPKKDMGTVMKLDHRVMNPFISTVVNRDRLGLNPIKKPWAYESICNSSRNVERSLKPNISHVKNVRILRDLSKTMRDKAFERERYRTINEDAAMVMKRYKSFKERCDKRNKVIGMYTKEVGGMPNDYKRNLLLNRLIQERKRRNERKTMDECVGTSREINTEEEGVNEEEKEMKNEEEEEMNKVLQFINTLDYDQYVKDKEIREALQLLKNKLDQDRNDDNNNNKEAEDDNKGEGDIEKNEGRNQILINEDSIKSPRNLNDPKPIIDQSQEDKKTLIQNYHISKLLSSKIKKFNRVHSYHSINNLLNREGIKSSQLNPSLINSLSSHPTSLPYLSPPIVD